MQKTQIEDDIIIFFKPSRNINTAELENFLKPEQTLVEELRNGKLKISVTFANDQPDKNKLWALICKLNEYDHDGYVVNHVDADDSE